MQPIVSTIIPVYNKEKYLNRCLESIVGQSLKDIEIILVNDGSTDDSLEICKEWESKDSRIIILDKANEGAGAARNKGLEMACGQYISFVDADDYISLETYEICVNEMQKAELDACYFGRNLVGSRGEILNHSVKIDSPRLYQQEQIGEEFIKFFLGNLPENEYERHFVTGSSCCSLYSGDLIRNNMVRFAGREMRYSEDSFFNLEFCQYAKRIKVIPDMLYFNCIYQDSTSRGYATDRFEAYKLLHNRMLELLSVYDANKDAERRIDFRFALCVCKCVRDEARYVKRNGIKKAYNNIKLICQDKKTQECIPKIIRTGYVSNRNMLLRLVVKGRAALILLYYLLKEKPIN